MPRSPIRIGVYGTGRWPNRSHIPNLLSIDEARVVALCDIDPEALAATAEQVPGARTYRDGLEMLEQEQLDVMYSCVRAHVRGEVEIDAARRGVHLFCEKPQSIDMKIALEIDRTIRDSGVFSTVCFRERYRPLFQEARRLLEDSNVCHVRYTSIRNMPVAPPGEGSSVAFREELTGGPALNWGCHAVDYIRFMTGLEIDAVQAFFHHRPGYYHALSSSFNYLLSNGATMDIAFISTMPDEPMPEVEPAFSVFFEGGRLDVYMYDRIEINGKVVYSADEFDPWLEQDKQFVEAVLINDDSNIMSDFHDGLFSLAPMLAGWQSARKGGTTIRISDFMEQAKKSKRKERT